MSTPTAVAPPLLSTASATADKSCKENPASKKERCFRKRQAKEDTNERNSTKEQGTKRMTSGVQDSPKGSHGKKTRKPKGKSGTKKSRGNRSGSMDSSDSFASSNNSTDGSCSSTNKSCKSKKTEKGNTKKGKKRRKPSTRTGNKSKTDSETSDRDAAQLSEEIKAQFVALDCEMVGTGDEGKTSTLARVSLVNWNGDVILDTFVKVRVTVTDLRTSVSGITSGDVDPESPDAMDFNDCVDLVQKLIDGKILVGHALKNDLRAMGITHPWYAIRDTAKYEPFMRAEGSSFLPKKLREIAKEFLGLTIQTSSSGHSPIEDAWTAMLLYQLVQIKWEKVMEYKVRKTLEIMQCQNMEQAYEQSNQHEQQDSIPVAVLCT